MVRWGGGGLPPLGRFFFQWLGVTRASDPTVPCGHRLTVLFNIVDVNTKADGYLRCTKKSPKVFLSVRYGVTRATGEHLVVKIGGIPLK